MQGCGAVLQTQSSNQVLSQHPQHLWIGPAWCRPTHWPRSPLNTVSDWGQRLAHFSIPTQPFLSNLFSFLLFLFSFFLFCCLCFSFPFHVFDLCLLIFSWWSKYLSGQQPLSILFLQYNISLAFKSEPTGLVAVTENGTSRVRRARLWGRQCPGLEPRVTHLSSVLWISAIFLSSFSECLGKNWNLEL